MTRCDELSDVADLAEMIDAGLSRPSPRGPYKRGRSSRKLRHYHAAGALKEPPAFGAYREQRFLQASKASYH
jgi:hypothetical protein